MRFRLAPRSVTLDDLELENNLFFSLGVNISQLVRNAVVRLALSGFVVCEVSQYMTD